MCRLYYICMCVHVFVCMCTHTAILYSLDIPIGNLILLVHVPYVTTVSIDCTLVGFVCVTVFIVISFHGHTHCIHTKSNSSAGNNTTNNFHSYNLTIYFNKTFQEVNHFSQLLHRSYSSDLLPNNNTSLEAVQQTHLTEFKNIKTV